MIDKRARQEIGQRLLADFRAAGATEVAPDILLPAETLLDLYGEDIRARAYVTHDPIRGEVMLRPDFTVPVVQMHMAGGAEPARYCYLGEVFRKQDHGDTRPEHPRDNEYLQAGFELFAREDAADAEVFTLFWNILSPYRLAAVMGDMRLVLDAIRALPLSATRREMLLHYIWQPKRFRACLARFSRPAPRRNFGPETGPWTGLRTPEEMQARIARLNAIADEEPLAPEWSGRLQHLLSITGSAPQALAELRAMVDELPQIGEAVERLGKRLDLIAGLGIDIAAIRFDASHGRQSMEYYDGMTFSFFAHRADWPPVASGGRYDALTSVLGHGQAIPAVGGIVRPGLLAELEALA
nr:ATP phosphoribosyltransferase regulatory subunit [Paracoccus sp. (in: a-proteobacteria)]